MLVSFARLHALERVEGVRWNNRMCAYHCGPILLLATARRVLFRSFRCKAGGMHLMVMCQMRLIRRRQNVFRLLKLGGVAVVPCCVLMMFSRTLMKFA